MHERDRDDVPSLESRLGVFLLRDPTLIERLPAGQAKLLDKLVEANGLEPLLYRLVDAQGAHAEVTSKRLSAWKMARLCASTRAATYRDALHEIVDWCTGADIPVRLLRGSQVAFYLCDEPEVRPVQQLELQTPPHLAQELYRLLKTKGYTELDDLSGLADGAVHHLPPLERDGVTAMVFRRSCAPLPWDATEPFPMASTDARANPEVLRGEPLLALLVLGIFEQSFCRSLEALVDLHRVLDGLKIEWDLVHETATRLGAERHFFCALTLLQEILGTPVDASFLTRLETHTEITPEFETRALPLVRSLMLRVPVPFDESREALSHFGAEELEGGDTARETQVLPTLMRRSRPQI